MIPIIILIVIVVLFFIFLFFDITNSKLKEYTTRIDDVELEIEDLLNNKFDNIIKINNIIKEKIQTEKEIIDDISNIRDEKTYNEIDNILTESFNKINYIKEQYNELDNEEELIKVYSNIETEKESLNAYKKYYNDNSNKYNDLISSFPYGITAKIFRYKQKELFNK
jgi:LemA protein